MVAIPILLLAFLQAPEDKPAATGSLSGIAVNSVTGAPLGKVELLASLAGASWGSAAASTVSDAKGRFNMVDLPPGQYRVQARRNGYLDTYYGARRADSKGSLITLEAGAEIKDLRIKLLPGCVLAGTVRDADGEPVSGAMIMLLKQSYERGRREIVQHAFFEDKTDDLGQYRITNLEPGKYYVRASEKEDDHEGHSAVVDHSPKSAGPAAVQLPTFYPGVTDPAIARMVDVGSGDHVTGIDIPLVRSPGFRVTVHASAAAGLQVSGLRLTASPEFEFGLSFHRPAKNKDGDFEFYGVPPGSYLLEALGGPPSKPDQPGSMTINFFEHNYRARTRITVDGNVDGAPIVLQKGTDVSGHITVEGETKTKVPGSAISFASGSGDNEALIREDNTFSTGLYEDRYQVYLDHTPDLVIKSIRSAGIDVFGKGVDIPETGNVALEIVLAPDGGRVDGVVLDKEEKPFAGATAVLIARMELRSRRDSFHEVTTDQNGRFHFENVPPGDYKLFAWDDVEPNVWFDPEFLKKYESSAEAVVVPVKGQTTARVHLPAEP
jgi:hypothetical protein